MMILFVACDCSCRRGPALHRLPADESEKPDRFSGAATECVMLGSRSAQPACLICHTPRHRAVLRTDAATRAIQMRDEAVARCEHMKQDLERCGHARLCSDTKRVAQVSCGVSSQGRTVDISANMTRQYKAMQARSSSFSCA